MQTCVTCGNGKPREDFVHARGTSKNCGECRAKNRAYMAKHRATKSKPREVVNAERREWRAKNLERDRANGRAWRARHPEKVRGWNRAYYEANRESAIAYAAAWQAANPEYVTAKNALRRARLKGATEAEPVRRSEIWERDRGVCGICREKVEGPWDLDHIVPLSRGGAHAPYNVQVAHPTCNREKWAHLAEDQVRLPV